MFKENTHLIFPFPIFTYYTLANCITEPSLVYYTTLSICLTLQEDDTRTLDQIILLNITHPETNTYFEAIYPIVSTIPTDDFFVEDIEVEIATSPWASVQMNDQRTSMIVTIEPAGPSVWYTYFPGSIVDIDGRVQILKEISEVEKEEKILDITPALDALQSNNGASSAEKKKQKKKTPIFTRSLQASSTIVYEEEFHNSAEIVAIPTQLPSLSPSGILPPITSCICDYETNTCLEGEFSASESNPIIRICLALQEEENEEGTTSEIDKVSYMKIEDESGSLYFEAVSPGGLVSPLTSIITPEGEGMVDMVIEVELLPSFFTSESGRIKIDGVSQVTYDVTTGDVPWEMHVSTAASEIITSSPTMNPTSFSPFDLEACHCNEANSCIQDPLVKKGDDSSPDLRVCIVVKNAITGALLPVPIDITMLNVIQEMTGAVLTLKDEQEREEGGSAEQRATKYIEYFDEDETTIVTIFQTSIFFLTPEPLPGIQVQGRGRPQIDGALSFSYTGFKTDIIPLEVEVTEMPSFTPSLDVTNRPSTSTRPSQVHIPSVIPSITSVPSDSPTDTTVVPSLRPSLSARPTIIYDPGVKVCVCDSTLTCATQTTFSEEDREARVCIWARPKGVELVDITFLAIVQIYDDDGRAVHSVLITPSSRIDDVDTSVVFYKNENPTRQGTIFTKIPTKFFQGFNAGGDKARMQGIAVINEGNNKNSQIDIDFNVDLNLIPLPSNMPSMLPSYSVSPTMHPTSSPIIALAKNLEIWGKCISVLYIFLFTSEFF